MNFKRKSFDEAHDLYVKALQKDINEVDSALYSAFSHIHNSVIDDIVFRVSDMLYTFPLLGPDLGPFTRENMVRDLVIEQIQEEVKRMKENG